MGGDPTPSLLFALRSNAVDLRAAVQILYRVYVYFVVLHKENAMTAPGSRSEVRRLPERARYDAESVHAVLDEGLVCLLGFEVVGRVPAAYRHREHGLVNVLIMHLTHSAPTPERRNAWADGDGALVADAIHEMRRYKDLADRAMSEISDEAFFHVPEGSTNPIAIIVKHLAGNLT